MLGLKLKIEGIRPPPPPSPTESTSVKGARGRKKGREGSSKTRVWIAESLTMYPVF